MSWTWQAMRGGGNGGGGAPIPQNGQPWGVIYSHDFSADASATYTVLQDYTFGGETWWLKGRFSSAGGYVRTSRLDTGTGLIVKMNGGNAHDVQALRWFMPFSQLSLYNPLAPVMVLGRVSSTNTANYGNLGLVQTSAAVGDLTAAEQVTLADAAVSTLDATTPMGMIRVIGTSSATVTMEPAPTSGTALQTVVGAVAHTTRCMQVVAYRWASGNPQPLSDTDVVNAPSGTIYKVPIASPVLNMSQLGLTFCGSGGGGGQFDCILRRVWVLQPKYTPP